MVDQLIANDYSELYQDTFYLMQWLPTDFIRSIWQTGKYTPKWPGVGLPSRRSKNDYNVHAVDYAWALISFVPEKDIWLARAAGL